MIKIDYLHLSTRSRRCVPNSVTLAVHCWPIVTSGFIQDLRMQRGNTKILNQRDILLPIERIEGDYTIIIYFDIRLNHIP